jgi:hypothetical protein
MRFLVVESLTSDPPHTDGHGNAKVVRSRVCVSPICVVAVRRAKLGTGHGYDYLGELTALDLSSGRSVVVQGGDLEWTSTVEHAATLPPLPVTRTDTGGG